MRPRAPRRRCEDGGERQRGASWQDAAHPAAGEGKSEGPPIPAQRGAIPGTADGGTGESSKTQATLTPQKRLVIQR